MRNASKTLHSSSYWSPQIHQAVAMWQYDWRREDTCSISGSDWICSSIGADWRSSGLAATYKSKSKQLIGDLAPALGLHKLDIRRLFILLSYNPKKKSTSLPDSLVVGDIPDAKKLKNTTVPSLETKCSNSVITESQHPVPAHCKRLSTKADN